MIILGIDPGSRFLGYAVISVEGSVMKPIDFGVLRFDPEVALTERLESIGLGVRELFKKFKPHHLSVEKIFLGKNADSAFKLGHARGVVPALAAAGSRHRADASARSAPAVIPHRRCAAGAGVGRLVSWL